MQRVDSQRRLRRLQCCHIYIYNVRPARASHFFHTARHMKECARDANAVHWRRRQWPLSNYGCSHECCVACILVAYKRVCSSQRPPQFSVKNYQHANASGRKQAHARRRKQTQAGASRPKQAQAPLAEQQVWEIERARSCSRTYTCCRAGQAVALALHTPQQKRVTPTRRADQAFVAGSPSDICIRCLPRDVFLPHQPPGASQR